MESQLQNAINISFDPSPNLDPAFRDQAFAFINNVRSNPSSFWQAGLNLFTQQPPQHEIVRHFALELVNTAIQTRVLDQNSLVFVRNALVNYIHQNYSGTAHETNDTPAIQNKVTQALTYLFTFLYPTEWQSFFDDFRALAGDQASIGSQNVVATKLYLRILGAVHDEIADQLMARSAEELRRNTELKDLIRDRDVRKIAQAWHDILGKWQQIDYSITEMCLKVISRWVSWTDISLVVNQAILQNLLAIAGLQAAGDAHHPMRNAAIDTFTETVAKKMKPPDKLELIAGLDLTNVVGQLVASPALSQLRNTPEYDTDLAETVAKLVNIVVMDIAKILDAEIIDAQTREQADQLAVQVFPYLLRFFADEYDEVCSTVIPSLTEILSYLRKISSRNKGQLPPQYTEMIGPALNAIVTKMKFDETASWGEDDEQTDEAEFEELRKRLYVLQQTVAAIDERLYIDAISRLVSDTFARLQSQDAVLNWRDLDLALHEMFLFGELAVKNGGVYVKREPSSAAASRLIGMMQGMVDSNIAEYPHPAIQLQYMEISVRYCQFLEHNPQYIPKVLDNFIRLIHSQHAKVKSRSWYLFLRLVRALRNHIAPLSKEILPHLGDLLVIQAEVPDESSNDDISSDEDDQSADAVFTSQLSLFEAIGCIASSNNVSNDDKMLFAQSVITPLLDDLQRNLPNAQSQNEQAVLQIHHIIQALGTLARGFSDWQTGNSEPPADSGVTEQFGQASEAVLVALERLNVSSDIRTAARFSFARFIGVLGKRLLDQLPRWIDGLLSQSSSRDEMAMFLRLLDQVVFAFKADIFGILDNLLTPLLSRVFAALQQETSGTDDEIQLAELRREYLNFINILLNHDQDLAPVLVSSSNQSSFESIVQTIEVFGRDTRDYPNARLAVSLLHKMLDVWGGANVTPSQQPTPSLPGFDTFALQRFSPLCFSIPATPGFNSKDAQARQVLGEIAVLQCHLLQKCGGQYVATLRSELSSLGLPEPGQEEFLTQLMQSDEKRFRQYFSQFVGRSTAAS